MVVALEMVLPGLAGYWLDKRLGTVVLLMLVGFAVGAFGKGARHFETPEALVEALQDCLHADMTVLIKGSRMMRMERIVAGIVKPAPTEGGR